MVTGEVSVTKNSPQPAECLLRSETVRQGGNSRYDLLREEGSLQEGVAELVNSWTKFTVLVPWCPVQFWSHCVGSIPLIVSILATIQGYPLSDPQHVIHCHLLPHGPTWPSTYQFLSLLFQECSRTWHTYSFIILLVNHCAHIIYPLLLDSDPSPQTQG